MIGSEKSARLAAQLKTIREAVFSKHNGAPISANSLAHLENMERSVREERHTSMVAQFVYAWVDSLDAVLSGRDPDAQKDGV